ncbi:trichohyalin-like isoform X1 [Gadus macrocephalus]|uniref:trichohyalin-like isoform X1 n=1 Tax=Gadus macrocephalus TaxID=80720 RepID=UPI0028CBB261|nr:trichohyalin-like isoform X1 [Gadus macrocephalus]
MWADEDRSLSYTRSRNDWESSFSKSSTRSFKPTGRLALADLDVWDDACLFKAQSSAHSGMAAVSGLGLLSNHCSPFTSTVGFGPTLPNMRQWMSTSDLAPELIPGFPLDPSRAGELHSAQGERGSRRAELVHRLQEAQQRLEDTNDLMKSRGQPRPSIKTTAQLLDMKHKANFQQHAQGVHLRQQGKAQYNGEAFAELREQENQAQDSALIREALKSVKEVNETLRSELKVVKQSLETSQAQLGELRAERDTQACQMSALKAQCTQLIQEKEEILGDRNTRGREEELAEWTEERRKLRETLDALHADHQRLQDRCLCLESEVLAKEEELCVKAQEFREQESERLSGKEEFRASASFWNEKWQAAALSLSSTQRELEAMKQQDPGHKLQEEATRLAAEVQGLQTEQDRDKEEIKALLLHKANLEAELKRTKRETNSILRVELDACKQQLELEKNRNKELVHTQRGERPVGEAVQTVDKETMTIFSMPPKMGQPMMHPDGRLNDPSPKMSGHLDRRMPAQENVNLESTGALSMAQQLANMQVELKEKEHALEVQEILREAEQSEAESTISALKLKLVKLNAVQGLQTLNQVHSDTDDRTSSERQNTKPISQVDHDRQRRMVTEQLKNLFKERKDSGKACDSQPAVQTHVCPQQELATKSQAIKSQRQQELLRCRNELYGSGLAPVSEEDEEDEEEEEEEKDTQQEQG